ncbi:hypothetical protein GALL_361780 [mine drainage metagenome]|uniref:Uncharacterized protein n=1 Tax=mine drainage metagenome TaxID=410659 RepID=A0A1J5R1J8_9ZZZZ
MFNRFDHYLSYTSTDQQTVRELHNSFSGLLVPGTVAAFQAEGTKGFILSLSARSEEPYVIDSRFPLFQNRLLNPKRSHTLLAEIFGVPELINKTRIPIPDDFDSAMIEKIAQGWIDFNVRFEDVKLKTFEKYAARLGEEVLLAKRKEPAYILPPYAMVGDLADGWWEFSKQLWQDSIEYASTKNVSDKLRRVVAAKNPRLWGELASEISDDEVVGWVSNLNEFDLTSEGSLIEYGRALKASQGRNQKVFALYGGFFSILLARFGLTGASHGIGFGEHRNSIELPTSGAPPARYYVPKLHRYIGVEIAVHLWRQFPALVTCSCLECAGRSPAVLDYHGLMRHSVRVRNSEIHEWVDLPSLELIERLNSTFDEFQKGVDRLNAPAKIVEGARAVYSHLAMWARVVGDIG